MEVLKSSTLSGIKNKIVPVVDERSGKMIAWLVSSLWGLSGEKIAKGCC